jgi:hypothetical protein
MTPENFTYWLVGYFEISGATYLSEDQTRAVKDHLDLVFRKVTPDRSTQVKSLSVNEGFYDPSHTLEKFWKERKEETKYC